MLGRCPSCERSVDVRYSAGRAKQSFGSGEISVVGYTCGSCGTILGVQADPIAVMADQTERVAKRLGAGPKR